MKSRQRQDPFLKVVREAERRPIRVSDVPVLDYTYDWDAEHALAVPGTLSVFVARRGSTILKLVRTAARGGPKDLLRLQAAIDRQRNKRRPVNGALAARRMIASDVFADLRYAGDVLNKGIFLHGGVDLVRTTLPYNGGRLARTGFSLAEYQREGSSESLQAVIVRTQPPKTEAEKAALNQVPANQITQNVGSPMDCETTYWAVAAFVAGLVGAAVTAAAVGCGRPELTDYDHVTQREIRRLGPAASARKLLDLRRNELLKWSRTRRG